MESAKDQFHSLTTSIHDAHQSLPIKCVFYTSSKSGTKKCEGEISRHDWDMVTSYFNSILHIPNLLSDDQKNAFKLLQVFDNLARHSLCGEHALHRILLKDQWLSEFKKLKSEIVEELEYYWGAINHEDSDTAKDEEDGDLEEDTDVRPAHELPIKKFMALCPNIDEEEVARKVSQKLEQPLGKRSRMYGCVYIISPMDGRFEGMLKIGFSQRPPENNRFPIHRGCFGEFEVIAVKSVKFAHRVEQILLAEFSGVRFGRKCEKVKCPSTHQEWLKIKTETIIESLDKWCTFFDEVTPYNAQDRFKKLSEDVELPSPASREYLRQGSSTRSTPKRTPQNNTSARKVSARKTPVKENDAEYTPTKKAPAKRTPTKNTSAGTPTKSSQDWTSPHTSPSYSRLKYPTISTTTFPSSDEEDSKEQVSEIGPEEFAPPPVGPLAVRLRNLKLKS
ncbi:hypothetical protein N7462_004526 [Penicillium macrosclerotiorum]|uniref:uncharacterized protein n=1 Tax=Penicillium macrosclerotiorum TaxID=303699 RepID=UPI00254696AE|nr:uncharacterized protein N7462_004526 [Penicillium macrosclerotiorum]KAJ5690134.1 hypothetical protein N7462_004526 [Penicillium macrosclerotiorum]